MSTRPQFRPPLGLARLRDIGWTHWDPIGLLPVMDGTWQGHPAADEYDRYLLAVATMLREGAVESECVAYLVETELVHIMGYRDPASQGARRERAWTAAQRTVVAIQAYLQELDSGPRDSPPSRPDGGGAQPL